MIHTMNDQMVVTNLRIPKSELIQLRVMAAELGISMNEYMKRLIHDANSGKAQIIRDKKKDPIWYPSPLIMQIRGKKHPYELSEEDEIIYGD